MTLPIIRAPRCLDIRKCSTFDWSLLLKQCKLESVLLQKLVTTTYSLIDFSYVMADNSDCTILTSGEIVKFLKCKSVETAIVSSNEHPISYNNKIHYMTPKTHFLMHKNKLKKKRTNA